jgi:aminopeptidase-like protein
MSFGLQNPHEVASAMECLFDDLWSINRSLTGEGNRQSLKILQTIVEKLYIREIPSGNQCFDWQIPPEWNIREAWIKSPSGEKIVDFSNHNLHVVGYSQPIAGRFSLSELKPHLHTLPELPQAIPYLCSYYSKYWGFCLSHEQFLTLEEGEYQVLIDADFNDSGSMSVGEVVLSGETDREILFSTYICHPSMANNELSGPILTAMLYQQLAKIKHRKYTYRFLFAPETIGAIWYLSEYGQRLQDKLEAGFVVTTVGDAGSYHFRHSRKADSLADRAISAVLKAETIDVIEEDFDVDGSDERQYCSPGFNLPVASLCRTQYGKYPEYHTSLDNKDFISFPAMAETLQVYLNMVNLLENNAHYKTTVSYCEPMLGKRNLHPKLTSKTGTDPAYLSAMKWLLNLSDGSFDLIAIVQRTGLTIQTLLEARDRLIDVGLLEPCGK